MSRVSRRTALLLPLATGGCSLFDSWFGDSKVPLDGRREAVTAVRRGLEVDASGSRAVTIPPPVAMPDWPQPGGGPTHLVGNVAMSGFAPAWRSSIGDGGGYRAKITAQPVVAAGRVYTMDSDGYVAAFALDTGSRLWRADTQNEDDRSTNVGGGVSVAGGTVYATTGRAELLALDAGSGQVRWRKPLGAPARSAATIAESRLLVLTLDDRVTSFSIADGERQWSYQASSSPTTLLGQAAPAFASGLVVAGFGSGDLVALRAESGVLAWSDSLSGARGRGSLLDLSAIRALPVIDNGRVFAIGGGGLLVSLDLRSGRRLWEREVGGLQTPWVAGDFVYVQTLDQTLAAIGRDDGRVRWLSDLPRYDNPDKRRDPLFWTGPVMAGNKLILAGSNGYAFSVDPLTGQVLGKVELRDAVAVAPVVASGTLLIVTDDGTLQAFR
jgi:outer membrane protein assembly factor BamB